MYQASPGLSAIAELLVPNVKIKFRIIIKDSLSV